MSNNRYPFSTRLLFKDSEEELYTTVPPFGSFCSVDPEETKVYSSSQAFESAIRTSVQPSIASIWSHAGSSKWWDNSTTGGFINTSDKPNSNMWDGCPPPHSMAPDDEENIGVLLKKLQAKCDRELGKTHCFTYDFATNKWHYKTDH